jgi:thymidylate synthase
MNKLDLDYQNLLKDILDNGVTKQDRTGTGTTSVFGRQIRHKMSEGFPLLTTKKMAFKTMVTELLWFLRGDTNIKFLVDNNCHIWDGDAYQAYLTKTKNQIEDPNDLNWDFSSPKDPKITQLTQEQFINKIKTDDEFAKKFGDLGKIYGAQWRSWKHMGPKSQQEMLDENTNWPWKTTEIDQIANLINDLKTNPDSRRLMVNAYNVGELDSMVLPPCHYGFQVYTRELTASERITYKNTKQTNFLDSNELYDFIKSNVTMDLDNQVHKECDESNIPTRAISLMFNMRSTDVGLGLGFNLASYGLLLMMIAKQVNMVPDELIYNGGDVHLYLNHIEPIKNQLTREPYPLPTVKLSDRIVNDISEYTLDDITLENYQSHPSIKMPLSN